MQARGQRPEVGGHLGRELDADRTGRQEPGGQRLGDRLVRVVPVGDERLGDRDGRRADVGRDHLGEAGQRRHGTEARLLGQEGDEFELRVEALLEPAVDLEQDRFAEDRRAVRLIGIERAFGDRRELVRQRSARARPEPAEGRQTRIARTWPSASRGSAAIVRPSAIATSSARAAPSPPAATRNGRPVRTNV